MNSSRPHRPPLSTLNTPSKSKRYQQHWRRQWRYYYRRFLRLRGSPESIARGLAAGVFTGLFPIFGLQIVAGVALATLIRGNKIMAAAGTWISNPLTSVPLFAWNFQVGQWVQGSHLSFNPQNLQSFEELAHLGSELLLNLLLGSFVMGLLCAVCSYFIGLKLFRRWHKDRQRWSRIEREG